jgi:hypothetical protein
VRNTHGRFGVYCKKRGDVCRLVAVITVAEQFGVSFRERFCERMG